MKKGLFVGFIVGVFAMLFIKSVEADNKTWKFKIPHTDRDEGVVIKIQDGNVSCYVNQSSYSGWGGTGGISCVSR